MRTISNTNLKSTQLNFQLFTTQFDIQILLTDLITNMRVDDMLQSVKIYGTIYQSALTSSLWFISMSYNFHLVQTMDIILSKLLV